MGDNTRFNIVAHWQDDFFIIDTDYICYMDLLSQVYRGLKLDCRKKVKLEGELPQNRRIAIEDDQTLIIWTKENKEKGNDYLHLYVEELNHILEPHLEEPLIGMSVPNANIDSNDDTFETSDASSLGLGSSDLDDYIVPENIGGRDDNFEYESENLVDDIYNSDSSQDRPYLDRAYVGKIYQESTNGPITLERGMLFASVDVFRKVLADYAVQEGFDVVKTRNERTRITATCAGKGCKWYLHASTNPDEVTFEIKVYEGKHTCVKSSTNSFVTSAWIASKMEAQFRADPNISYETIREHLLRNYGVEVSNSKLYRAKKKAREQVEGDHAKTYSKIRKYAEMVRIANPGSVAKLQVERSSLGSNPIFKRFFLCLDAMKNGFLKGCRPFIGMDGCHLKGPYGGVMLSAISLDGNNGIFPVAFAIVEVENKDSWTFFLELLDTMIGASIHDKPFVIMTDRQKGLDQAINEVFPTAQHRCCCRHLYANFKVKFPGMMLRSLFWKAARSYCDWEFKETMQLIKQMDAKAFEWLDKIPANMWSRQAFDPRVKSDHITNNMTESFNQWVGPLRGKPVLMLIESLVVKLMAKIHNRYSDGCIWEKNLTPGALKKIESMKSRTNRCSLVPAARREFSVNDDGKRFPVDLEKGTCHCKFWEICGLPCKHALACISYLRLQVEEFCDHHYSKSCYQLTYSDIIHPIPDLSMVEFHENPEDVVQAPILRRLPGRPRKNRKREADEGPSGPGVARRSATVTCDICKEFGHNRRTCQRAPVAAKRSSIKSKKKKDHNASRGIIIQELMGNTQIGASPPSQVSAASKCNVKGKRKVKNRSAP